jgi:uncharacterized protein (TIGR02118 family)
MKVICLLKRKEGTTAEQFRDYYETRHAPLALSLLPYFSDYRRNYIRHDLAYKPEHIEHHPGPPPYDVVMEFTCPTQEDADNLMAAMADPEIGRQLTEDEAKFMDRDAMVLFYVDECVTPMEHLKAEA